MLKNNLSRRLFVVASIVIVWAFGAGAARAEQDDEPGEEEGYNFRIARRVNAHGDEYNAVAETPDGRRLVIGTEKGEVLVWDVAAGRIVRRFVQGSPVHDLVALADGQHVVAAGGAHYSSGRSSVARKWDIESGAAEDWPGAGDESFFLLATEPRAGLVAGATVKGRVVVWAAKDGRVVASWEFKESPVGLALVGQQIFLTTIKPIASAADEETMQTNAILALDANSPKSPPRRLTNQETARLWGSLVPSPDGRLVAARYYDTSDPYTSRIALLDVSSAKEVAAFEGQLPVWQTPKRLLLFDDTHPVQSINLRDDNTAASVEKIADAGGWHGSGQPEDLTGAIVSRDGASAWGVFRLNAALVKWDLRDKSGKGQLMSAAVGNVYAMTVLDGAAGGGLFITGGDDGFVRVWNLADFSLRREFAVPFGVPQGVALTADGRRAVFSYGGRETPTEIAAADLDTGQRRVLLKLKEPFVKVSAAGADFIYGSDGRRLVLASARGGETLREFVTDDATAHFAVSANGRWLAVAGEGGGLSLYEVATGRLVKAPQKVEALTCLAVANDGRSVYTTEFKAAIRRWDITGQTLEEIGDIRGQCRTLRLSQDESRLLVGGNHRDVAVYDLRKRRRISYFTSEGADFYVTGVWLKGERLVFTTDGGVLFDGALEKEKP